MKKIDTNDYYHHILWYANHEKSFRSSIWIGNTFFEKIQQTNKLISVWVHQWRHRWRPSFRLNQYLRSSPQANLRLFVFLFLLLLFSNWNSCASRLPWISELWISSLARTMHPCWTKDGSLAYFRVGWLSRTPDGISISLEKKVLQCLLIHRTGTTHRFIYFSFHREGCSILINKMRIKINWLVIIGIIQTRIYCSPWRNFPRNQSSVRAAADASPATFF